jgi:hypothetical protein
MSIDIRPIKIMFDTNIPGKQSVPFTKSLLYNPELKDTSGLDEYPYFTMDTTFPFSYLNSLSYEKRLNFFFNKSEMMKTFKIYKKELFKAVVATDTMPEILTKDEQAEKKVEQDEINAAKQTILQKKEQLKKLGAEAKIIEAVIQTNIETYTNNKKGVNESIAKKMSDFEKTISELSDIEIQKKIDELFAPATTEKQVNENATKTSYFKYKTARGQIATDSEKYIDNLIQNIKVLFDYFKVYIDDETITDAVGKIIDDEYIENITGKIDVKLKESYKVLVNIKNDIQGFLNVLNHDLIEQAVTDKDESKIKLETENTKKSDELEAKKTKNEQEQNKLLAEIEKLTPKSGGNTNTVVTMDEETQKIARAKEQTKNGDENVLIMLRLLFPTKYPIMGNVFSSFNSVILKTSDFTLSFSDFLPSFLRTKLIEGTALYSYLKIDGKVYTVAQAVWLNDIYNHKEYADLIDKFKKLKIWKDKSSNKLNDEIRLKLTKFKTNYGNGFDQSDISYIESQRKDTSEATLKLLGSGLALEKLTLEYRTYNATVDDFINTVKAFQKSVLDNDPDTISDNAKNMVDTYKLVTKYGSNFFKPKDKFNQIIENVNRDLEDIRINEYIRDRYMSKPGVDLDYEKDDQKYTSKLKSNFKEYTEFADNIKKFKSPNKESSNYELQKTFNEFLENREKYKGLFNFLMNPYNININPFDNVKKKEAAVGVEEFVKEKANYHLRKNTGVTILPSAGANDPGYEIYVELNVIAGELNDENKSLVDCLYQGDSLGNKLEYLVNESLRNPWDINSNRLFFDITEGEAGKEIENKKKEESKAKSDQEKSKEKSKEDDDKKSDEKSEDDSKKGGKIIYNMNTRKLRGDIIKTRKNRFV